MTTQGPLSRAGAASKRRPRLLVVTSLYPTPDRPEAGAFVARRVESLRAAGVEVEVVAASSYRQGPWRRHIAMLVAALRARGPIRGVESHVLLPASLIGLLAARLRRVPLVVYAHGHDVVVAAQRSPVHRRLARLVARGAARVVTNSSDTARYVEALGVVPAIISPGVDLDVFRPGDRRLARGELGVALDARVALYVGSVDHRKGADVFADAIRMSEGWLGIIVGTGPLDASLRRIPAPLRFVGNIRRDDVPRWMVAADVVVVPSRREPLGLAAIEALACGVPVIATSVGGLAETVLHEVNGLMVGPDDPAAVAQALHVLERPGVEARLAARARESVARHDLRLATLAMAQVWRDLGVAI